MREPVVKVGAARGLLVRISDHPKSAAHPCYTDFQGAVEAQGLVDAAILKH